MTTISGNTLPQSLLDSVNGGSRPGKTSVDEAQDRFMTLLVTQMKNQDPLNPMDNQQVTSQMAQLSTVTGIDKLNKSFESMITGMNSNQGFQAANMIGHGVMAPGEKFSLIEGKGAIGFDLASPADDVKIDIKDKDGNVVRTLQYGAAEPGATSLVWDGKNGAGAAVPAGEYTFEVSAQQGGKPLEAKKLTLSEVLSVSTGPQGVRLNLSNNTSIPFTDVREIV